MPARRTQLASALALLGLAGSLFARRAPAADELPRVSTTRKLAVAGIVSDPKDQDLLGITRVRFQGMIASELRSVGYNLVNPDEALSERDPRHPPLTLVGTVKEEACDDDEPRQCRVAIQWELQDNKGVVVYRTVTRAVDRQPSLDVLRRGLVEGALRSLLLRPRFTLQLTEADDGPVLGQDEAFGFKQCRRAPLQLPEAARAVAAALVLVESGSTLSGGTIVSPDGFVLTSAAGVHPGEPLRVRLSAQQTRPASVAAIARDADVALLHVEGHFDTTCVPLRQAVPESGLSIYGVSSELSEERAVSLAGGTLQAPSQRGGLSLLQADGRIASTSGAPLLDQDGQLVGVVTGLPGAAGKDSAGSALEASLALGVLRVKPAPISDPRLTASSLSTESVTSFVRDRDDPAFVLSRRYTYGTSRTAHDVRRAGLVTALIGAALVGTSWALSRTLKDVTPAGHTRLIVVNDVGFGALGLGALGFGLSFALPEGHDVVAVRSAAISLGEPIF